MSRNATWQRVPSDCVSWRQDQALGSTIYILREVGPTSFLLKEDGVTKKFKVSLGNPHVCNCTDFKKEKELCKHICWILLKKFKLERQNELSYQLGLVEREINEVLRNPSKFKVVVKPDQLQNDVVSDSEDGRVLQQRELTDDDVCPICQDNLLSKRQPVTFCRYGCGNSVHIKCMKVWADHQRNSTGSSTVLCPFCREEFGSQTLLAQEFRNTLLESKQGSRDKLDCHLGVRCSSCGMEPIKGKCYKCSLCTGYHLCNTCYHNSRHADHTFVFRLKKAQRWRTAPSRSVVRSENSEMLISPIMSELQSREITENDYETLLELDAGNQSKVDIPVDLAGLPEHIINRLPMSKVKQGGRLTAPGKQCRLCLHSYKVGQLVRRLPDCGHIFHRHCIDEWLKRDHRRCPVDGTLVTDPEDCKPQSISQPAAERKLCSQKSLISQLVIPGIGLLQMSSQQTRRKPVRSTDTSLINSNRLHKTMNHISKAQAVQVTFNDILAEADVFGTLKTTNSTWICENQFDVVNDRNDGGPGCPTLQLTTQTTNQDASPVRGASNQSSSAARNLSKYKHGLRRKPIVGRKDCQAAHGNFSVTGSHLQSVPLYQPRTERRDSDAKIIKPEVSRCSRPSSHYNAKVLKKLVKVKQYNESPVAPASSPTADQPGDPHNDLSVEERFDFLQMMTKGGLESKNRIAKQQQKLKRHRRWLVKAPPEEMWGLSADGRVMLNTVHPAMGVDGMHLSKLEQHSRKLAGGDRLFTSEASRSAPAALRTKHRFTDEAMQS